MSHHVVRVNGGAGWCHTTFSLMVVPAGVTPRRLGYRWCWLVSHQVVQVDGGVDWCHTTSFRLTVVPTGVTPHRSGYRWCWLVSHQLFRLTVADVTPGRWGWWWCWGNEAGPCPAWCGQRHWCRCSAPSGRCCSTPREGGHPVTNTHPQLLRTVRQHTSTTP